MNWLKAPPLNSLRAFSVVAESESFSRAAKQLNVTHAAISQQIKLLESHLQMPLVARSGRGIRLTEDGQTLARDLTAGFSVIGRGIERLTEAAEVRPVRITTSPAFASEWLMPRLTEFQADNPGISMMVHPTVKVINMDSGETDIAIRYRDRRRSFVDVSPVLISDMVVIGHPSLVGGIDLSDPSSLVDMPWLQELGTNEVAEWLTFHGVVPDRRLNVTHLPGNLIMDALRRGEGISYTARAFFRNDLDSGRLTELFSDKEFGIYYVETRKGPLRSSIQTFLEWLYAKNECITK